MHLLERINNLLLLNSNFSNIGINGKMGIVIYLYHYSKIVKDNKYKMFAENLLDEITDLPSNISNDFSNGLLGIGFGISFLNRSQFLSANLDEVLEVVDKTAHHCAINYKPAEISSLLDVGRYLLDRVRDTNKVMERFLFIELLIIITDKVNSYLNSLGNESKISDLALIVRVRIFQFLQTLNVYSINRFEVNSLLKRLKDNPAKVSSAPSHYLDIVLFLYVDQLFGTKIEGKDTRLMQSYNEIVSTLSFYNELKFFMIESLLFEDYKSALRMILKEDHFPSVIRAGKKALDIILPAQGYINVGLNGLSGLGLLLLNKVEKNMVHRELISRIIF